MLAITNHTGRLIFDSHTGIQYEYLQSDNDGQAAIYFTFPTGHTDSWHGDAAISFWRQLRVLAGTVGIVEADTSTPDVHRG